MSRLSKRCFIRAFGGRRGIRTPSLLVANEAPYHLSYSNLRLDVGLRHPLHGEFPALLGAVEKIKIDQLLVRKAGPVRQTFEIVHDLRAQVDSRGLFLGGVVKAAGP